MRTIALCHRPLPRTPSTDPFHGPLPRTPSTDPFHEEKGDGTAVLKGDLTLHGVTRPVSIDVKHIGHGPDPWGGYRRGFEGSTTLTLADYNIDFDLGPAAREVELFLSVEGIRQ